MFFLLTTPLKPTDHNFHCAAKASLFCNNVHTDLDEVYGAMYDQLDEVAGFILMNDGSPLGLYGFLPQECNSFRGRKRALRTHRRFKAILLTLMRYPCTVK